MWDRWRGRPSGLAAAILPTAILSITLVAVLAALVVIDGRDHTSPLWRLVVRDAGGVTVAEADLVGDRFALRYRNSVYGTRAEERFWIGDDGLMHLVGLASDEAAVLGEYYSTREVRRADRSAGLRWEAEPASPVTLDRLLLAATDLGERSLVVDGQEPIDLWRLVTDASPGLSLGVERVR